jgi:hypothetical protein
LNNHEQNILPNVIVTGQSLTLNSQTTAFENADPLPITTNNFKETINLSKLELVNQPTRLWHNRTLEELRDKTCSAVQVEGGIWCRMSEIQNSEKPFQRKNMRKIYCSEKNFQRK